MYYLRKTTTATTATRSDSYHRSLRLKQQLGREKKEACALVASGYERGEINNEQQPRQPKGFRTCMGPTVLAGGQASMQEQL